MSNQPINLRQARKAKVRAEKARAGDERAALYGRSKGQKAAEVHEMRRAQAHLDGHKRDD